MTGGQPLYVRRITFKIDSLYPAEFLEDVDHERTEFHKVIFGDRAKSVGKDTVIPEKYHGADPFQLIDGASAIYFRNLVIQRQQKHEAVQQGNLL